MTNETTPIVTIKNNAVVANSRDVAVYFCKRHDNVVRDIENLLEQGVLNFEETPYVHEQNGQTYRSFDMTRDGFTLLAMGFTGKKALQFKLRYIEQFNAMEAELKRQQQEAAVRIPQNYPEALRVAADEYERRLAAEQRARELEGPVSVDNLVSKRPGVATPVWSDKLRSIINLLNYHSLKERPRREEDQIKGRRGGT